MKLLILFLLSTTSFAAPTAQAPFQKFDIWGTCYFQFNCQGNPIGLGKTGAECRTQGGHSLFMQNANRCFNL